MGCQGQTGWQLAIPPASPLSINVTVDQLAASSGLSLNNDLIADYHRSLLPAPAS
jgi:hypothetical protein